MIILGLMSGTSLDGLDIACCLFDNAPSSTNNSSSSSESSISAPLFRLLAADTVPYPDHWRHRLASLHEAAAYDYALAHVQLGHYFGLCVNSFLSQHPFRVDAIASHGHTVFHQPHLGLSSQIGCGDALAAATHLPVVCNFRAFDVALGGQGAPLVPIGDRLLFPSFDACLNLGGFSNISFDAVAGTRVAFDVSPCNMALNLLAARSGCPYDPDGTIARSGSIIPPLLDRLNALDFYAASAPKSLGKEWFLDHFAPLLSPDIPAPDLLRTVVEHIAYQVHRALPNDMRSMLVTGGGAHNAFLVQRISDLCAPCAVTLPDDGMIDYKEAVIFALLGFLRLQGRANCLASVTGAAADGCGGDICGVFAN